MGPVLAVPDARKVTGGSQLPATRLLALRDADVAAPTLGANRRPEQVQQQPPLFDDLVSEQKERFRDR